MACCGNWSEVIHLMNSGYDEIQEICSEVKSDVEAKTKENYREFRAIEYCHQLVAGTNYLIRVQVGEQKWIDIVVWKHLPQDPIKLQLTGIRQNRKLEDPFEPFNGFN
uniref:Cystatin-B n=1 Tax=Fundulus heteroclitus TaxID=8078 RepID=A0A3Q2R398_FUNHE